MKIPAATSPRSLLGFTYSSTAYRPVDLTGLPPATCRSRVEHILSEPAVRVAYGGYLERRQLYRGFQHFGSIPGENRNIHLGVDFWAPEGTPVCAPADGLVHSWSLRPDPGDYGAVLIMEHRLPTGKFYTLYGHLSAESLVNLVAGAPRGAGETLGFLGGESENGGYFPHLHFQLICQLGGYSGDYPGVCAAGELQFYRQNCPDPIPFLGY